jgi:CheY-like chemotaxis protein
VYSEPGYGSTFKVYLPRLSGDVEATAPPAASTGALGGTETVLVVEDQADLRHVATQALRQRGYAVLQAASGDEALGLWRGGGGPKLVLTDVVMPGMSGPELAERLRAEGARVPVIFMSGYSSAVQGSHGMLPPGATLLEKPFTSTDLARAVRRALDGAEGR